MRRRYSRSQFTPNWRLPVLGATAALLTFISAGTARGQTTTFAEFSQNQTSQMFQFASTASSGTFTGSADVSFKFDNGFGASLAGQSINATMIMNVNTTAQATSQDIGGFQALTQTINQVSDLNFSFTDGQGHTHTLLDVSFTAGVLGVQGGNGGQVGDLQASSPPDRVVFTSDYLDLSNYANPNFSLTLNPINPNLSINSVTQFLNDFTTNLTGNFSVATPEPASLTLVGLGFAGFLGANWIHGRKKNTCV
jgi:hypothetical protein